MQKTFLKAHERFSYYFTQESNKVPTEPSNNLLVASNEMLLNTNVGSNGPATRQQQPSNSGAISKQQPGNDKATAEPIAQDLDGNPIYSWVGSYNLRSYTIDFPSYGKNLVPQFELLKEFISRYNAMIDRRREPFKQKLEVLKGQLPDSKNLEDINDQIRALKQTLASDPFQKLRGSHHILMKELIAISRDSLVHINRYLKSEGLNKVEASDPFSVEVSYPALANRLQVSAHSTLYRQLRRLHIAGFLAPDSHENASRFGKVFHGTNAPFEVRLNPMLMVIFDKENPEFEPEVYLPNPTEKRAPQGGLRANCNHISSLKSIESSLIEDVRNSEQAQNDRLTSPMAKDRTLKKRTPKKCAKSQWEAPSTDPIIRAEIRSTVQGKRRTWAASDFGGDFKKLLYARVFLLVQAALGTLWKGREIYQGTVRKTEDYLLEHYLQGVSTEQQLDERISEMLKVIERNTKYIAADPGNRFAQLPLQYFDVRRKPKDEEDYSGFMGQLRLLRKSREWIEVQKATQQVYEKKNQLIKLKRYLRKIEYKGWTKSRFDRTQKWIDENAPLWKKDFLAKVAYNQELPTTNSVK